MVRDFFIDHPRAKRLKTKQRLSGDQGFGGGVGRKRSLRAEGVRADPGRTITGVVVFAVEDAKHRRRAGRTRQGDGIGARMIVGQRRQ